MKILLPHLETNVTLACQNRCWGCNHFVPLHRNAHPVQAESMANDLAQLGRVAHAKRYALLGGEPLLHPHLLELLDVAKSSGIADQVEVITNGQRLRLVDRGFWTRVDYLTVSVYPGKLTDEDIVWIRMTCKANGVQLEVKDARSTNYFNAVLYKTPLDDDGAAKQYRQCWYRTYTHVIDNGVFYRCCTAPFIAPLILGLPAGSDGIRVDGLTVDGLRDYLTSGTTPAACKVCGAHNGPSQPWHETSREDWLNQSEVERL
jgi:GTP 3',8-cyclase